jgi:hypothetical protein
MGDNIPPPLTDVSETKGKARAMAVRAFLFPARRWRHPGMVVPAVGDASVPPPGLILYQIA